MRQHQEQIRSYSSSEKKSMMKSWMQKVAQVQKKFLGQQPEKENYEQFYLRPMRPAVFRAQDFRKSETIKLRHIVPYTQIPKQREMQSQEQMKPPKFTKVCRDINIFEGNTARFEVRYEPTDDHNMKIEWFKDGRPLMSGSRFLSSDMCGHVSLKIMSCVKDDSGIYSCRATNKYGVDNVQIKLSVSSSELIIERQDQTLQDSRRHDSMGYQVEEDSAFFKREINVEETFRPRLFQQQQVAKKQVMVPYTVTEDSAIFTREITVEEVVVLKPRFITSFKSIKIHENEDAHFKAKIEPQENLMIEWFFKGQQLQVGSRWQHFQDSGYVYLDILRSVKQDSGEYLCRISNEIGFAEKSVRLEVISTTETTDREALEKFQYLEDSSRFKREIEIEEHIRMAPRFLTPFKPVDLQEWQVAHFECRIEPVNDPDLKIEWFFEDTELTVGSRFQPFNDFGFVSLNILKCIPEDSGTYTCRLTNKIGSASQSVTLTCSSRTDLLLETNHPDSLSHIELLERKRVDRKEMATPEVGAPRFLTPFADQRIHEREAAHFEARIEPVEDPNLKVEWFFNGQELQVGSRWQHFHDFGYVCLNILQSVTEDTGEYMCRVSNNIGFAEETVRLEVITTTEQIDQTAMNKLRQLEESKFKRETTIEEEVRLAPRFLTPFKPVNLQEGQVAHFECRIEPINDPDLKIEWFFNETELTVGSRFQPFNDFGFLSLNILQCIPEDSGTYTCRLSNKVGSASQSVTMTCSSRTGLLFDSHHPESLSHIKYLEGKKVDRKEIATPDVGAPRFLAPFQDQRINEREAAHFETRIEPVEDPNLKVEWFFNGQELQVGSRWQHFQDFGYLSLNIMQSVTEDSGEYLCRISNAVGFAEQTVRLEVVTSTETIDRNLRLQHLEDSSRFKRETEIEEEIKMATRFVNPFKPLDLHEGQVAHVECRIEPVNDPDLKIEWFFNETELMIGSRYQHFNDFGFLSLNIFKCIPEDSGTYTCKLTNKVGSATQSVTMTCSSRTDLILDTHHPESWSHIQFLEEGRFITEQLAMEEAMQQKAERMAPVFVSPPEPVVCVEGDVAKFQCRIIGYPRPRIMWVLNGNTCVNGTRFKLTYDGIYHLEVSRARLEDDGKLEVYARNIVGEASCSTTLTVKPKRSDYRAVLKNSPRPWYDHEHARYQKERYENELEKVFEEKLVPGGAEVKVWRTEESQEGHVKVLETLTEEEIRNMPEMRQYKTDIFYAQKSQAAKSKKEDESNVSWMAKSYQSHIGATESTSKPVQRQQQPQTQKPQEKQAPPAPQQQQTQSSPEQHPQPQTPQRPQRKQDQKAPSQQPQSQDQKQQQVVHEQHQQQQAQQKQFAQQVQQKSQIQQQQQQIQQQKATSSTTSPKKEETGETHGKQTSSLMQEQVQKEFQTDKEITRKITQKDTLEREHTKVISEVVPGDGSVAVPPVFTVKIYPVQTRAGQNAVFKCEFKGNPPPNITWYKNETPIQNSHKFQVSLFVEKLKYKRIKIPFPVL